MVFCLYFYIYFLHFHFNWKEKTTCALELWVYHVLLWLWVLYKHPTPLRSSQLQGHLTHSVPFSFISSTTQPPSSSFFHLSTIGFFISLTHFLFSTTNKINNHHSLISFKNLTTIHNQFLFHFYFQLCLRWHHHLLQYQT